MTREHSLQVATKTRKCFRTGHEQGIRRARFAVVYVKHETVASVAFDVGLGFLALNFDDSNHVGIPVNIDIERLWH